MSFSRIAFSLAALMAATGPALAVGDCAPFGKLDGYDAQFEPAQRLYGAAEFRVDQNNPDKIENVGGKFCYQVYTIKDGANMMADLEIQKNHEAVAAKLGGQTLFTDDRNIYGRMNQGGKETWYKVYSQENEIQVTVIEKQPFKPRLTQPGPQDFRLFGHLPEYDGKAERRNFGKETFRVQDGDDIKEVTPQGTRTYVVYIPKTGPDCTIPKAQCASDIDAILNYQSAMQSLGGEVLFQDDRHTTARAVVNGQTIWMGLYTQENEIQLTVIEEKAFEASMKPPQASSLKAALDKDGRVALYVNFDFAKATLRPDAAPVIAQVVKLMQDNPALKLSIDGHTDDIGANDFNLKLSQARAAAMVSALVAQGIAADRLQSAGFGEDKPMADNNAPDGRAKNRRVELVKL